MQQITPHKNNMCCRTLKFGQKATDKLSHPMFGTFYADSQMLAMFANEGIRLDL